ncbi:MAG: dienelactone hydrolase family protein [Chloroflexota bacterium]|nr:dienelactone hydrolase family protein [Chloroflexota bacterium]
MPSFWENIQVDGQDMDMYASVPSGSGPFSAIVVSQHGGGVDRFIQTICDRFAEAGYAAVAPNLYHRVPDDVLNGDPRPRPWDVLSDPDIVADINATVDFLRNHPAINGDKIGITGFCMGGRVAWLGAASNPHINALAPYYGGNILVTWGAGEIPPFELANDINCPILFHFGEVDENPSQDDMRKFDAELTRLGKAHQFYTYPGADHAFMDFTGPRHHQEAADASWPRTLEFFAAHIG